MTLAGWPSLSEMKQKEKEKKKKKADFARCYTATKPEVKLKNPDYHPLHLPWGIRAKKGRDNAIDEKGKQALGSSDMVCQSESILEEKRIKNREEKY